MDVLKTITVGGVQYDIAPKASYDTFGAVRIGTGLMVGTQGNDEGTISIDPDLGWVVPRGLGLLPRGCRTTYDPFLGRDTEGFATCIGTKVIFSEDLNGYFGTVVRSVLEACNGNAGSVRPDLLIGVVKENPSVGPGIFPILTNTLSEYRYPISRNIDGATLPEEVQSLTIKLNWLPCIEDVEEECCRADVCCTTGTMIYTWNADGIYAPSRLDIHWGSLVFAIGTDLKL